MNRIILIGNGFDLAHKLPTDYRSFIDNLWAGIINEVSKGGYYFNKEDYFSLKINSNSRFLREIVYGCFTHGELQESIKRFNENSGLRNPDVELDFENRFLEEISKQAGLKNWVDVENEYYKILKSLNHDRNNSYYDKIDFLNDHFSIIEKKLEEYLKNVEEKSKLNKIVKIDDSIYAPLNIDDISHSYLNKFLDGLHSKIKDLYANDKNFRDKLITYQMRYKDIRTDDGYIKEFIDSYLQAENKSRFLDYQIKDEIIPRFFMAPDNILFLNFNYTHTSKQYIFKDSDIETIHIHGELNSKDNPMIFGYGDEIGEDYKTLENLNDNKYLKNVKSIRYLETDNYRRLLSFVESEPYQILIMGHSCGNSDRTLLNTLFEHKNCVSIKPYYYIDEDGKSNYSDIVQNISRNFTSKPLMRDRVVNKVYCKSLT